VGSPLTPVVDHLSNLIRLPSVSAMSNHPVIDYAASVLSAQGWTMREAPYRDGAEIEKVNLVAAPPGQNVSEREVDLVFLCHTDTVPYANDWLQALEPTVQGQMLHGCGACDVKGFLACLLTAADSKDARWIHGLRIVLTADEEVGCVGSKRLIATDCLRPQRLVVGEPTSLRAARAGKGYCLARISMHGREAHSALPAQGLSAIYAAAHLVSALEELSRQLTMETHSFFEPGDNCGRLCQKHHPGTCRVPRRVETDPGVVAGSCPDCDTRGNRASGETLSRAAWITRHSQAAGGF
jgi:acetylornithine deacetylase